jgi:hypothetical protein
MDDYSYFMPLQKSKYDYYFSHGSPCSPSVLLDSENKVNADQYYYYPSMYGYRAKKRMATIWEINYHDCDIVVKVNHECPVNSRRLDKDTICMDRCVITEVLSKDEWGKKYITRNEYALLLYQYGGFALKSVPKDLIDEDMCDMAIGLSGYSLEYVPEKFKTERLCLKAVSDEGGALEYVPEDLKTIMLCSVAVETDMENASYFVPEKIQTKLVSF